MRRLGSRESENVIRIETGVIEHRKLPVLAVR